MQTLWEDPNEMEWRAGVGDGDKQMAADVFLTRQTVRKDKSRKMSWRDVARHVMTRVKSWHVMSLHDTSCCHVICYLSKNRQRHDTTSQLPPLSFLSTVVSVLLQGFLQDFRSGGRQVKCIKYGQY